MVIGKHPIIFTVFGGTGDLTYRKLIPALYNLKSAKLIAENVKILIVGRRDFDDQTYIEHIRPWVEEFARLPFGENVFDELTEHMQYIKMDFTNPEDYAVLHELYGQYQNAQFLYYYAVAPEFFPMISNNLLSCGCMDDQSTHQVMIEKPFGTDGASARDLHDQLLKVFDEKSIYRIDHYLGKEMIQNIMSIRFNNVLFKNVWDHRSIDYIAISAFETVGVENRGAYYEQAGAIKDMLQNHLFQILSVVLMEEPTKDVQSLFDHQTDIIRKIKPIEAKDIKQHLILGQYQRGSIDGKEVVGYTQEKNVMAESKTETFVALKVFVEHPSYKDIPIYLQTGKRTDQRSTEVLVVFKAVKDQHPNVLTIRISPDEGVYLKFNAKKPGNTQEIVEVSMDFCQSCVYENRLNTPEAYERLLFAAFNKDKSLFTDWSMVMASWGFIDQLNEAIRQSKMMPLPYPAGSHGPEALKQFLPESYFIIKSG